MAARLAFLASLVAPLAFWSSKQNFSWSFRISKTRRRNSSEEMQMGGAVPLARASAFGRFVCGGNASHSLGPV